MSMMRWGPGNKVSAARWGREQTRCSGKEAADALTQRQQLLRSNARATNKEDHSHESEMSAAMLRRTFRGMTRQKPGDKEYATLGTGQQGESGSK